MKDQAMSHHILTINLPRAHPIRWLVANFVNLLALRQTRQRLAQLEPHLLRDIGLTVDQAHREAARPVWDAPKTWVQ